MKVLRGLTWDHPRAVEPLVACSIEWQRRTGIAVRWERHSLQDFESQPLENLAQQFDLLVIDHPHIGAAARRGILLPLDEAATHDELRACAAGSIGSSFASYSWDGRQWALPIDAATQVQAVRPDRRTELPGTWSELLGAAREGRVGMALRNPHPLLCFFSLASNAGVLCRTEPGNGVVDQAGGTEVLERFAELVDCLDPACFALDPVGALEAMSAQADLPFDLCPAVYLYASYARNDFRPHRLEFAPFGGFGGAPGQGATLGGTGIAVSALSQSSAEAAAFSFWASSAEVQRTIYATPLAQPAHVSAWTDEAINAEVHDLYRVLRPSLELSWVRPRFDGYVEFQRQGSDVVAAALRRETTAARSIEMLNTLFNTFPAR